MNEKCIVLNTLSTIYLSNRKWGRWMMPVIDVNTASKSDLLKLRGIGNSLADAVIKARPYKCRSELLRVPGITE
jgi:predicted DNA-binding helix-hairpin-helix protein